LGFLVWKWNLLATLLARIPIRRFRRSSSLILFSFFFCGISGRSEPSVNGCIESRKADSTLLIDLECWINKWEDV
jgi:Zn-dependent protease